MSGTKVWGGGRTRRGRRRGKAGLWWHGRVFSVSPSQEDAVKRYIAGQAEHHKNEDFTSELRRLLRAHGVEFDERYAFD
ncbi:MAG: hypothetical protein IPK69_05235 [Phycisphaerales bacterium]|nr:MAG: hypothetical protein IPK69_05235 [Phycisphaerales bacterium]